jgi:DNA-directed RNA polymerase specialized sigma24 family protein
MTDADLVRLAELIDGTTAARGVDTWVVEVRGLSAADWAEMTGRNRSTVARNIRRGSQEQR